MLDDKNRKGGGQGHNSRSADGVQETPLGSPLVEVIDQCGACLLGC